MSMTINQSTYVAIPDDMPLATATGGQLHLWPAGVGVGPCIQMTYEDWYRLRYSADATIKVAQNDWSSYLATEGNGDAL